MWERKSKKDTVEIFHKLLPLYRFPLPYMMHILCTIRIHLSLGGRNVRMEDKMMVRVSLSFLWEEKRRANVDITLLIWFLEGKQ